MGDPVGADDEKAELIWKFREMCDIHAGWPVFYEVQRSNLHLYLDARPHAAEDRRGGARRRSTTSTSTAARASGCARCCAASRRKAARSRSIPAEGVPEIARRTAHHLRLVARREARRARKASPSASSPRTYIERFPGRGRAPRESDRRIREPLDRARTRRALGRSDAPRRPTRRTA